VNSPAGRDLPTHTTTGDTAGDAVAEFALFYRQTTKPLVAFLIAQGATLAESTDVAQDAMADAFRRWRTIDHPRAWVFRVASRAFIRLRVETRETPTDPLPHSPLLRGGDIERWELDHDLVQALDGLPPRQRQVIAWTLADYTPAEIAEELCLSGDTVRQHLHRARKTLSTRLAGKEPR
jgi:RNA polymerase sigma-70 factor (ECF subfamily)